MPQTRFNSTAVRAGVVLAVLALAALIAAATGARATSFGLTPSAWLTHPSRPGPDIPPAGRSLFDQLMLRDGPSGPVVEVPYPFTALLEKIDRELSKDGLVYGIRQVRIPLGRGLHREAAAPHYFHAPTRVVAVDAPASASSPFAGLHIRDRLYLSYQPRSGTLEVISYNETAGRFEFQLVTGYGAAEVPSVRYARRLLCLGCHQNAGPIFSAPVYQETDVNGLMAMRLDEAAGAPAGTTGLETGPETAFAIAEAARRMTSVPGWQALWRHGCGDTVEGPRCRAEVYLLALQYRLSGYHGFDRARARNIAPAVARNAAERWPSGFYLASSRIPDRVPLAQPPLIGTRRERAPAVIGERDDPLSPRAPLAHWPLVDGEAARRLIEGVAELIPLAHARKLDEVLTRRALRAGLPPYHYEADCEVIKARRYARFMCGRRRVARPETEGPGLVVSVFLDRGRVREASVSGLVIDEESWRSAFEWTPPTLERTVEGWKLVGALTQPFTGLGVRSASGTRIAVLTLTWTESGAADANAAPSTARARLTMVDDFSLVEAAMDRLGTRAGEGAADVLSAMAFQPGANHTALQRALGAEPPAAGARPRVYPPFETGAVETGVGHLPASSRFPDLVALCAACHSGPHAYPPAFLRGSRTEVERRVAACAERIWMRVAMWGQRAGNRPKSPMPPVNALPWLGFADGLPPAAALDRIERHAEAMVGELHGREVTLDALFARGYRNAMQCEPRG